MIYFLSDVHLGLEFGDKTPKERELFFCNFLDSIKHDCEELFLLGDIFDFWFEWKRCVPKGYVRTLAKLSEMAEGGIKIHFFVGNHDLWIDDYFTSHIGLIVHPKEAIIERQGKKLFLLHSDSLYKYTGFSKVINYLFRKKSAKWLAQRVFHPDAMIRFGTSWSTSNRKKHNSCGHQFLYEDDYWVKAAREILHKQPDLDYFIFGHLHVGVQYDLNTKTQLIVLGEWIENPLYATMQDGKIELHYINY